MLPSYIKSFKTLALEKKLGLLNEHLKSCRLCPHKCSVNRLDKQVGICKSTDEIKIWRYKLHTQEEPPISGTHGSGIIFFSGCSGKCLYCQNYTFSNLNKGHVITPLDLAKIMLELQGKGAHNINLVSATHFLPQIFQALIEAVPLGLSIPLVYNCSGYENIEILEILDNVVDIYLIDAKYKDDDVALRLSGFKNYSKVNLIALRFLWEKYSDLVVDKDAIAQKGLIIRHLVLPGNLSQTQEVLKMIKENLSEKAYVSLMSQYTPIRKNLTPSALNRPLQEQEYETACKFMIELGFENGWTQGF